MPRSIYSMPQPYFQVSKHTAVFYSSRSLCLCLNVSFASVSLPLYLANPHPSRPVPTSAPLPPRDICLLGGGCQLLGGREQVRFFFVMPACLHRVWCTEGPHRMSSDTCPRSHSGSAAAPKLEPRSFVSLPRTLSPTHVVLPP